MRTKRITAIVFVSALCATLLSTVGRAASPVLIAIGTITGFYEDFSVETAAPLENGVAGNRLGGIGSGFAYAGGTDFLALPDRGPNAVAFNPCTDDTVSYINRFESMHMTLAPSDPGFTTLPFTLTPMLVGTTLLSSPSPLIYGAGCGLVEDGEPALNKKNHTNYFTGRSDNFGFGSSTNPNVARFDTEGIRVSNDGNHVYISDEYGPFVYEFQRQTGKRTRIFTLPDKFAVDHLYAQGALEISGNAKGRVTNKGMEGLAITPDGRMLVGAMQSPLIQDGGDVAGGIVRLVTIDLESGFMREYAYQLDKGGKKTTVSEIVAINNTDFLVDERDSKGLGDDSVASFKKLFRVSIAGAHDVGGLTGAVNLAPYTLPKTEFLNIVSVLTANGMDASDIPAKLEGLAFGQDVTMGHDVKHTLWVANDNDYLALATKTVAGVATKVSNPNRWFVFAFGDADLPGFVPQQFKGTDKGNEQGKNENK